MALKLAAVPLPELDGKTVLDIGTDMGGWAFLAAARGARDVLGLDRNREVKQRGVVDLVAENRARAMREGQTACRFERINLGREWREYGRFDVILALSVYHHIFEQCGDHHAIWFWLSRHCAAEGQILWEGPVDDRDPVVQANVADDKRNQFSREAILVAARQFFEPEFIGPALHEPTREVWRFRPQLQPKRRTQAVMQAGAGGATAAFEYMNGRRIEEIEAAIGLRPVPGSLNLRLDGPFDWDAGYSRARVLDVKDRAAGLNSPWAERWARFYPLTVDGVTAHAFRFEGERYDHRFMELIAPVRLRELLAGPRVMLER